MDMFNKRISQNVLMVFIINVFLVALGNTANIQNSQNSDQNRVINGAVSLPLYGKYMPNLDVNFSANNQNRTKPVLTAINGPNTNIDIADAVFSENISSSSLGSDVTMYFHEGVADSCGF
tara:strand:+ start:1887 stop:2246 length:360 start_codon:yes stop_codon:yes gene_type:complete